MARGVRDLQEVELLEGEEPDPPDASAGPPAARPWRRRALLAAVLVAVGLVGVQQLVDARERAAMARVAELDGVIRPLGDTIEVATLDAQAIQDLDDRPYAQMPQVVLGPDGSQSISPMVADGGQPSWSTPVLGPDATRTASADGSMGISRCVPSTDDATTAVCLVTDGYFTFTSVGYPERVPATTTKIVVIETDGGEVVTEWAAASASALTTLPGLAVVGDADESVDGFTIVAHDQRSGTERWRYVVPRTHLSDDQGWAVNVYLLTVGELVMVSTPDGLTLLDADGQLVRDDFAGPNLYGNVVEDSLFVISTSPSGVLTTTTVVAPDGDPASDRVYVGEVVNATVDDGSVPGLVLAVSSGAASLAEQLGDASVAQGTGPGVRGYDGGTGEELWFVSKGMQIATAIVLDETVYVTSSDASIVALDAHTGETLWSTPDRGTMFEIFTDGRLVYSQVVRSSDEGGTQLVGWDLHTGAEVWRAPLPEGIDAVSVANGTLVGSSFETGEFYALT